MLNMSFGIAAQRVVSSFFERGNVWQETPASQKGPLRDPMMEHGLIGGTLIATDTGWRPVETLSVGDMVLTFDRGMQPIREIHRAELRTSVEYSGQAQTQIFVPAGAIGNRLDMTLLPEQEVLVESDTAETEFGDAFVLIEAQKLVGYNGVRRTAPREVVTLTTLAFEFEEVIHACGNALLLCPSVADLSALDCAIHADHLSPYQRLSSQSQDVVAGWLQAELFDQPSLR